MLFDASVLLDAPLVTIGVVAVLAASLASKLRMSAWWVLVPGAIATGIAGLFYSPVSSCNAASSVEVAFGIAILVAIGFYVGTALTALVDGVRLVRRGATGRALLGLLPFLLGAALAVGTFFLAIFAIFSCLE